MQLGTGMRLSVPDVDELHKAAVQDTLKGRGAEPVAIPEKRVETFDFGFCGSNGRAAEPQRL